MRQLHCANVSEFASSCSDTELIMPYLDCMHLYFLSLCQHFTQWGGLKVRLLLSSTVPRVSVMVNKCS